MEEAMKMVMRKRIVLITLGIIFLFSGLSLAQVIDASKLYQQAVTLMNRHDYDAALDLFKEIISNDNLNLEAYTAVIDVYIAKGKLDELQKEYEKKLADNGQDLAILYVLGNIAYNKKEIDKARDYLVRALSLAPDNPFINLGLMHVEIEKKNFNKAKEYLDVIIKNAPDSYNRYLAEGYFYFIRATEQKNYQDGDLAIKAAKVATDMRSYEIETYQLLGMCYMADLDYPQAEKILKSGLDLDKFNPELNALYGIVLLGNGEYQKSISHFLLAKNNFTEVDKIWGAEKLTAEPIKYAKIGLRVKFIFIEIIVFVILIFSIIFHECSHGWLASRMGDPTAKNAGRLSLNPFKHLDIFGSILLPAFLIFSKANFFIGYAKPVPFNPQNFKRPKRDEVLVSLAGPLSNIVLGLGFIFILIWVVIILRLVGFTTASFGGPDSLTIVSGKSGSIFFTYLLNILKQGVITTFLLAGFNLIPIPPLDGSHILTALLPGQWLKKIYALLATFGFILIIVLAQLGILSLLLTPMVIIIYILFAALGL
jgi:Zn-dependent protease/Tfp pilus assembly protein PilF